MTAAFSRRGIASAVGIAMAALACAGEPVVEKPAKVYIIPIQHEITQSIVYTIRRGLAEAAEQGAGTVILNMNTPGGSVDATRQIMTALLGVGTNVHTITFVNTWAMSAGAFISIATDHIYMAPLSQIGAAAPIVGSPTGGAQDMPETMNEKMVSALTAVARSAAEAKGHNKNVIEAMIRIGKEDFTIGDDVISKAGQLLTLTNTEAERKFGDPPRALLSSGTVKDLDELLEKIGLPHAERVELRVTNAEKIAHVIQALPFIFLTLGMLCLYIEFKTPGFGIFGITGVLLLLIWFWANYVAGLAGSGELLAFLLGLALLAIEIFVIPGFGIVGIAGVVIMLGAILMAMVPYIPSPNPSIPGLPGLPTAADLSGPGLQLCLALVLSTGAVMALARYLPETRLFRHLALTAATDTGSGFTASAPTDELLGQHGIAITALRPGGTGDFNGRRLSVISRGQFIEAQTPIHVVETRGSRVVVEQTEA